jgi:hypothetical protein
MSVSTERERAIVEVIGANSDITALSGAEAIAKTGGLGRASTTSRGAGRNTQEKLCVLRLVRL